MFQISYGSPILLPPQGIWVQIEDPAPDESFGVVVEIMDTVQQPTPVSILRREYGSAWRSFGTHCIPVDNDNFDLFPPQRYEFGSHQWAIIPWNSSRSARRLRFLQYSF